MIKIILPLRKLGAEVQDNITKFANDRLHSDGDDGGDGVGGSEEVGDARENDDSNRGVHRAQCFLQSLDPTTGFDLSIGHGWTGATVEGAHVGSDVRIPDNSKKLCHCLGTKTDERN